MPEDSLAPSRAERLEEFFATTLTPAPVEAGRPHPDCPEYDAGMTREEIAAEQRAYTAELVREAGQTDDPHKRAWLRQQAHYAGLRVRAVRVRTAAPRRAHSASGRPRAQATRSSARSGDSGSDDGEDEPAGPPSSKGALLDHLGRITCWHELHLKQAICSRSNTLTDVCAACGARLLSSSADGSLGPVQGAVVSAPGGVVPDPVATSVRRGPVAPQRLRWRYARGCRLWRSRYTSTSATHSTGSASQTCAPEHQRAGR